MTHQPRWGGPTLGADPATGIPGTPDVLLSINGLPTILLVSDPGAEPWLVWNADEYSGGGTLWLYVPVDVDEAAALAANLPLLLDDWLAERQGRTVFVGFAKDRRLEAVAAWVVDLSDGDSISKAVVRHVRRALRQQMIDEDDRARRQQLSDEEQALEIAM